MSKYYVTPHPDADGEYKVIEVDDVGTSDWVSIGTRDHCEERARALNAEAKRQETAVEQKRHLKRAK